ncbi:MAG: response regulator [Elusimicrobia bacterium]|nr:response regulator [Elusimicrobiota bacterium]
MPDVLVFDDDPALGDLLGDLLRARKLSVSHFLSGSGLLQIVQEGRPRLVVLDIMMPGMDGLSACQALKASPVTGHIKIVVVTAKHYGSDREAAERFGADLFVQKPFDPGALSNAIGRLLGMADEARPLVEAPPAPPVMATLLEGSAALESAGLWALFDAGRGLGEWLAGQARPAGDCWICLTRYDEDALDGLAAAAALLRAGCRVKLAGPEDPESRLQHVAPRLSSGERNTPLLYPQRETVFQLAPGIMAVTQYTHHPGPTIAYRVDLHGKRFVYCPTHEIPADDGPWTQHERAKFRAFFQGADLLVHGFGRSVGDPVVHEGRASAWEPVVDLAKEAQVKRLALVGLPGALIPPGLHEKMEARAAQGGSSLEAVVGRPLQRILL